MAKRLISPDHIPGLNGISDRKEKLKPISAIMKFCSTCKDRKQCKYKCPLRKDNIDLTEQHKPVKSEPKELRPFVNNKNPNCKPAIPQLPVSLN